jgi:hypothetical protein
VSSSEESSVDSDDSDEKAKKKRREAKKAKLSKPIVAPTTIQPPAAKLQQEISPAPIK